MLFAGADFDAFGARVFFGSPLAPAEAPQPREDVFARSWLPDSRADRQHLPFVHFVRGFLASRSDRRQLRVDGRSGRRQGRSKDLPHLELLVTFFHFARVDRQIRFVRFRSQRFAFSVFFEFFFTGAGRFGRAGGDFLDRREVPGRRSHFADADFVFVLGRHEPAQLERTFQRRQLHELRGSRCPEHRETGVAAECDAQRRGEIFDRRGRRDGAFLREADFPET